MLAAAIAAKTAHDYKSSRSQVPTQPKSNVAHHKVNSPTMHHKPAQKPTKPMGENIPSASVPRQNKPIPVKPSKHKK